MSAPRVGIGPGPRLARPAAANTRRSLETGAILGALTLLLAATGLLLSPTLGGPLPGFANALYVSHLAAAVLLVAFVAWHLWPLAYAFARKAGQTLGQRVASLALLALVLVEIASGYVLWSHDYRLLPKAAAVAVHLATTGLILVPLAAHALRGLRTWRTRRDARFAALSAADAAGRGADARRQHADASRRAFLRLAAYGTAGVALAVAFGRAASTQVKSWRLNSVGLTPKIAKEAWRLRVGGLVQRPIEITYDELVAMPSRTLVITHRCVEGWTYTDEFTGVPLKDVLAKAGGLRSGAKMLIFKSPEVSLQPWSYAKRYSSSFPVQPRAMEESLVVYKVAGEDLPPEHGYPVRLMTPTKWGYKACKWLTEIEVSPDEAYRGYWERGGYHPVGDWPGPIWG